MKQTTEIDWNVGANARTEQAASVNRVPQSQPQLPQTSRISRLASALAGVVISSGLLGSVVLGITSPNSTPSSSGSVECIRPDIGEA